MVTRVYEAKWEYSLTSKYSTPQAPLKLMSLSTPVDVPYDVKKR